MSSLIINKNNQDAVDFLFNKLFYEKEKIVTIWGAGSSIESGIPGGYYLMQRMTEDLKVIIGSNYCRDKLGDQYEEIYHNLKHYKNVSFEYVMSLYSRIYDYKKLHSWIKEFIKPSLSNPNPPYFPGFCHEYCSHLAHSGLLKYFISINFDEILEATLEEELGYTNFKLIASLSEFESLKNINIDEWADFYNLPKTKCFVFKPHGTISRALTLRYSPDKVSHFELEKRDTLIEVLKDAVIVLLGFGNYNENFWLLFGETYSMGLTKDIIIVDKYPDKISLNLPDQRINNTIFKYEGKINDFFFDIFNKQEKEKINERNSGNINILKFKQLPTRHLIRSKFFSLFSRSLTKLTEEQKFREQINKLKTIKEECWYDLRIYELELLIYLFKSRGLFIQLASIDNPKIKNAYEKCLKIKNRIDLEPSTILNSIINFNHNTSNKLFGRSIVKDRFNGDSINIYWCFLIIPSDFHKLFQKEFKQGKNVKTILFELYNSYCKEISKRYGDYLISKIPRCIDSGKVYDNYEKFKKEIKNKLYNSLNDYIALQLSKLISDFDIHVVDNDISVSMRFKSPKLINERGDFIKMTNKLYKKGNRLRIATISAEWLKEKININKKINKIEIISNLEVFKAFKSENIKKPVYPSFTLHYQQMMFNIVELIKTLVDSKFSKGLKISWYALRNLQHHMTIVSNENNDEKKDLKAIYFRRVGKNAEISPVYLDNYEDTSTLKEYFDNKIISLKNFSVEGGKLFEIKKGKGFSTLKLILFKRINKPLDRVEFFQLKRIFMDFIAKDKNITITVKN